MRIPENIKLSKLQKRVLTSIDAVARLLKDDAVGLHTANKNTVRSLEHRGLILKTTRPFFYKLNTNKFS